jgi:DNA-binding GntR family transcriptional regulator
MPIGAIWRDEIDAVEFWLEDACRFVVHRNVFRTLLGRSATPGNCLSFAEAHAEEILAAARARRGEAASGIMAFHLNSRQLRRAMGMLKT